MSQSLSKFEKSADKFIRAKRAINLKVSLKFKFYQTIFSFIWMLFSEFSFNISKLARKKAKIVTFYDVEPSEQ